MQVDYSGRYVGTAALGCPVERKLDGAVSSCQAWMQGKSKPFCHAA